MNKQKLTRIFIILALILISVLVSGDQLKQKAGVQAQKIDCFDQDGKLKQGFNLSLAQGEKQESEFDCLLMGCNIYELF